MKKLYLLTVVFLLFGCKEIPTKESLPIERISETVDYPPVSIKKFVLVVFETEEPYLIHSPYVPSLLDMPALPEQSVVRWQSNVSVSKVVEYENFTNDEGYRLMDDGEKFATIVPESFRNEVNNKVSNHRDRERLLNNKTKITKRYYLTFDSYSEASIKRQELLNPQSN